MRRRSVDYCRFKSWEEQYVEQRGFDFLNSSNGSKLTADIHDATMAALESIADPLLSAHYEAFTSTNERRDIAMIESIEAHCASSALDFGILLVGAAHRRSLFEKLATRAEGAASPVSWDFLGIV